MWQFQASVDVCLLRSGLFLVYMLFFIQHCNTVYSVIMVKVIVVIKRFVSRTTLCQNITSQMSDEFDTS